MIPMCADYAGLFSHSIMRVIQTVLRGDVRIADHLGCWEWSPLDYRGSTVFCKLQISIFKHYSHLHEGIKGSTNTISALMMQGLKTSGVIFIQH